MATLTLLNLSGPSGLALPHPQSRQQFLISIGGYASFMLPSLQRYTVVKMVMGSHVQTCQSLSQFTLYFHQVLAEHASVYDMKHLAAKLDVDYITE